MEVPKRIKLIVNKGEHLSVEQSKKSKQPSMKWRVLFMGVEEKMATAKVESEDGSPVWVTEITVTAKNPRDPISLLVTDSKGNHAGQVVIPLEQVPPKPDYDGKRPPLLSKDLFMAELEPTKKISRPHGYIYYWIWTEDYWLPDEIAKYKTKKSLSKSLHNLSSSALNLFRHKSSTTSVSKQNGRLCSPGNPFDPGNISNSSGFYNPTQHHYQNSINSMKNSETSSSTANSYYPYALTTPNSPVVSNGTSVHKYNNSNPFEHHGTPLNISIDNNIDKIGTANGESTHTLAHKQSVESRDSPNSKKWHGIFIKSRAKKSKSSADLVGMMNQNQRNSSFNKLNSPQSLGKQQGQRLFEKKNDSGDLHFKAHHDRPMSMMIDSNMMISQNGTLPNVHTHNQSQSVCVNRNCSFDQSTSPFINSKKKEDMSKRELIEISEKLESQLVDTMEKLKSVQWELSKTKSDQNRLNIDLSSVREELGNLKVRLLEAGHTQYLEKNDMNKSISGNIST